MRRLLLILRLLIALLGCAASIVGVYTYAEDGKEFNLLISIIMLATWPAIAYNEFIELKDHENDD